MTTAICQLNRKLATATVPGTGIVNRWAGLSLGHGPTIPSTFRGYARAARARPLTPNAPSSSTRPAQETSTKSLKSRPIATPTSPKSEIPSNIKLPSNFKLAKLEPVQEYDPNMVIFLDKHGKVTMIPHDDRVTGQTKEERDSMGLLDDSAVEGSTHQRGSKEMDYGRKRIGQVEMPKPLQDAIRSVLDDEDKSLIRTDALRLYGSLRSTGALDEDQSVEASTKRIKSGSGDLSSKGDRAIPAHILEYGHRESTAYIAAMSPTTYSAISNVLEEVNRRVPDLDPKTILDFGTGPGTAIWAANEVWQKPIQYTGVDTSMAMLETAEVILDSLSTSGEAIKNVAFKPFMSHGSKAQKFDVVMSAFVLSELTSPALRRSTLEHLWNSTNDMLILIDRGTPSGFKILAEAREQILGLDADLFKPKPKYDNFGNILPEEKPTPPEPAHVLAPCPHDKICPMYASLAKNTQWCHFSQKVQRPDFLRKTKHSKENFEDAKYTYVVLRKGPRPALTAAREAEIAPPKPMEDVPAKGGKHKKQPPPPPVTYDNFEDMFNASHSWSRIVVPPIKKDGHVVMDTCGPEGFLERMVIPRSQGKIPYRDARKATWGDLFPHLPKNKPVRKDSVQQPFDGSEGSEVEPNTTRRRPPGISAEQLLKRAKQKEKKQNRQKLTPDEIEGKKGRGRKDDEDITIEF
ncbi:37S ribosomal protein S22 [Podila clonocystis]|nr:37S ribosomal protein S22 [Podila clonocystis]